MEQDWGTIVKKKKGSSKEGSGKVILSEKASENRKETKSISQVSQQPIKERKRENSQEEDKKGEDQNGTEWTQVQKKDNNKKFNEFEAKTLSYGDKSVLERIEKKTIRQKQDTANSANEIDEDTKKKWEMYLENNEQTAICSQIKEYDDFPWSLDEKSKRPLNYIAGMDISFSNLDPNDACCYIVVQSYPSLKVVYEGFDMVRMKVPYVPGFLGFREGPHFLKLFNTLIKTHPEFKPDVILFDGNGVLHTRGCGIASHMGVILETPSIGIGKTFFAVDGLGEEMVLKKCKEVFQNQDSMNLVGKSKRIWGAALKTNTASDNPIYVSVGHRICLETACKLVWKLCKKGPLPEPVNLADKHSRNKIKRQLF